MEKRNNAPAPPGVVEASAGSWSGTTRAASRCSWATCAERVALILGDTGPILSFAEEGETRQRQACSTAGARARHAVPTWKPSTAKDTRPGACG